MTGCGPSRDCRRVLGYPSQPPVRGRASLRSDPRQRSESDARDIPERGSPSPTPPPSCAPGGNLGSERGRCRSRDRERAARSARPPPLTVVLAVSPVVRHGRAGDWGRAEVVVRLAVPPRVSRVAPSGFYRLPPPWCFWAAQGRDRVDLSKGRRRWWWWRTEVTARGDGRRPRCSRGPPHLGWGGAPSGCSPLLRPTRSAAAARSPARPGAALPPRLTFPLLLIPIVSTRPSHPPTQGGSAPSQRPSAPPAGPPGRGRHTHARGCGV